MWLVGVPAMDSDGTVSSDASSVMAPVRMTMVPAAVRSQVGQGEVLEGEDRG